MLNVDSYSIKSTESHNSIDKLEHEVSSLNPLSPTLTHDTSTDETKKGTNKRGPFKPKSLVWSHFGVQWVKNIKHGKCNYYKIMIAANPKYHGTTSLLNHLKHCK